MPSVAHPSLETAVLAAAVWLLLRLRVRQGRSRLFPTVREYDRTFVPLAVAVIAVFFFPAVQTWFAYFGLLLIVVLQITVLWRQPRLLVLALTLTISLSLLTLAVPHLLASQAHVVAVTALGLCVAVVGLGAAILLIVDLVRGL